MPRPALAAPGVARRPHPRERPAAAPVDDAELAVLQSPRRRLPRPGRRARRRRDARGRARGGGARARRVRRASRTTSLLRAGPSELYTPGSVNAAFPADTARGDFDGAFAAAAVQVDATYSTPAQHNNPMEPHATLAVWEGGELTLYDSTQGAPAARDAIARVFGLDREQVRVISPHVGGGFGSKGTPRPSVRARRDRARRRRAAGQARASRGSRCSRSPATGRRRSSAAARRRARRPADRDRARRRRADLDGRASSPSRPRPRRA